MCSVSRENDVLKLVYPGGFVEFYRSPITAAQVMKRNPRHCVTRPDVFKFPWIVVRPESILKPGRVFYVVPYHTIRLLLQSKGHDRDEQENFSGFSPRPKVTERKYYYRLQYDDDDDHHDDDHHHQFHRLVKKDNFGTEYPENYKVNIKCDDAAAVGTGDQKYQRPHQNEQQSEEEAYLLLENVHKVDEELLPRAGLKSCLKKHNNNNNNIAKSRGLRVRFVLDQD
ncbi:hypothetical protein CISIN_1g044008mg [Citrus sinensis]|uniref:Uncharacterized protein n=1 Tax=Citrus sinensis TaxID=2711 RepID=A0A067CZD2_CITSI|nr:hypothetical protein CISIN_1g044008mg [Citrus sinensis]